MAVVIKEIEKDGIRYRITEDLEKGLLIEEALGDPLPPETEPNLAEQVADQEQRLSDVELVMAELLTGGI